MVEGDCHGAFGFQRFETIDAARSSYKLVATGEYFLGQCLAKTTTGACNEPDAL